MATLGEIAVNVVARTAGFDAGMKRASRTVTEFAGSAASAMGTLAGMLGVVGGFSGLGFAVKLAADAQTATVAIANMTGGLETAKQLIADINRFAVVTPFEPAELRESAQSLLAFGFGVGEVMPTLQTLGDVAAGSGTRLIELVRILGKVRDRGRVTAETLSEFGIRSASVMEALAQQMGVGREAVAGLASTGKISFADLVAALQTMTTEGGLFANAMAKQSETIAGKWSTLTGNVATLAENVGSLLLPALSGLINQGNLLLDWLLTADPAAIKLGLSLAGGTLAVLGAIRAIPLLVAAYQTLSGILTIMIGKQTLLAALSGPAGWVKIGAAIAATVAVTAGLNSMLGDVNAETKRITDGMAGVGAAAEKSAVKVQRLNGSVVARPAAAAVNTQTANGVSITSRSLVGSRGATAAGGGDLAAEIDESNEYLQDIAKNTAGSFEIQRVTL